MNASLLLRIQSLITSTTSEGTNFISRTISELRVKVPDYEGRKFAEGEQPSEDHMILSLLSQVINAVGVENVASEGGLEKVLKELRVHQVRLEERQIKVGEEEEEEEREQKKRITTDDMHIGFETKTVSPDSHLISSLGVESIFLILILFFDPPPPPFLSYVRAHFVRTTSPDDFRQTFRDFFSGESSRFSLSDFSEESSEEEDPLHPHPLHFHDDGDDRDD